MSPKLGFTRKSGCPVLTLISPHPFNRCMIKEQLDGAGIKLSSDEHVIVEINPDDEYVIDGKHKALVLR